jgi:hypothetical protein
MVRAPAGDELTGWHCGEGPACGPSLWQRRRAPRFRGVRRVAFVRQELLAAGLVGGTTLTWWHPVDREA